MHRKNSGRENSLIGFVFIGTTLGVWEGLSRLGVLNKVFFPPFSAIFISFGALITSGELAVHLGHSLYRFALGYLLAVAFSIPLGILMGKSRFLYSLLDPLIEMLRPIPSAAIIPVSILLFGIYTKMNVAVIAYGSLWPILINTIHGVRGIDPILLDTGRTFNLSRRQFLVKIIIPAASPNIATGMRISSAIALILTITVEMVAGSNGLGFMIINWERSFHFQQMYAGILALGILGFLLNYLFSVIDNKVMSWYKGYTSP